jgi:hypothetical protein
MPKSSPMRNAFNAGEFSSLMEGRTDYAKYGSACKRMENFIPTKQGPAYRRPGTRFVKNLGDSLNFTRGYPFLMRYEYNNQDSFALVGQTTVGGNGLQVFTDHAFSVAATLTDGYYGDFVFGHDASGRPKIDYAQYGAYMYLVNGVNPPLRLSWNGQNPLSAYTIWAAGQAVIAGQKRAYGNNIYTSATTATTGATPPTHTSGSASDGAVSWTYTDSFWRQSRIGFEHGPFNDINDTSTTVAVSGAYPSFTITSTGDIFSASDVNRTIRIWDNPNSTYKKWTTGEAVIAGDERAYVNNVYRCTTGGTCGTTPPIHTSGKRFDGGTGSTEWEYYHSGYADFTIDGFLTTKTVTATIPLASMIPSGVTTAHAVWQLAVFYSGYQPEHITFYRNRLVVSKANRLYFSQPDDFENFNDRNDSGDIAIDSGVNIPLVSDQVAQIEWIAGLDVLVAGTSDNEFSIGEADSGTPFGPTNIKVTHQTTYGSVNCRPQRANDNIVFVTRTGRNLREIGFEVEAFSYRSVDLSAVASHAMKPKVMEIALQADPDPIYWMVRSDGELVGFTYDKVESVLAWHRHQIGGADDGDAVRSVIAISHPDRDRDELWLIVEREYAGGTAYFVEYLEREFAEGDDQSYAYYVDGGIQYDGASTSTITGLGHLEGRTVQVLADGATHPDKTVASGQITLDRAAEVVSVGLGYDSLLQTLRIEAGSSDGSSQGKTKRISRVIVRMLASLGGFCGPAEANTTEFQYRDSSMPMNQPPTVYTGDKIIDFDGGYDADGYIFVKCTQPLPFTLIALMPQVVVEDDR